MGNFIFDELTGVPTILATGRAKRMDQTGAVNTVASDVTKTSKKGAHSRDKQNSCPFCKGSEHETTASIYQDADDWNVRVFLNKYPIVDYHEIIVHSPLHTMDIAEFSHEQNVRLVRAYLTRTNYHTSQNREVLIFNNRGGKAGASILHPHSQLIALPGFPGIIELEKQKALRYLNEHNSCYWCDMIKEEIALTDKLVFESKHFVLMVPEASRWSFEMILIPKAHRPNFEYIDEVEINDFARMLKAACYAYDKMFDRPDRNFWVHSQKYDPFHWHVGFIAHIKVLGGLELGAGIWVSDRASPKDAAGKLRKWVIESYEGDRVSLV